MATMFACCASATQSFAFLSSTAGTATIDTTTMRVTNPASFKLNTSSPAVTANIRKTGILADAGRRISFWMNWPSVSPSASGGFATVQTAALATVWAVRLRTDNKLDISPTGASAVAGTTVLTTNRWYHICLAYTITSSTSYELRLYLNGKLEVTVSSNGTLTNTVSDTLTISVPSGFGTNFIGYFDELYVDNVADLTFTGLIGLTNKRPFANGTTNGFTTQIGSGGSSYGSGHAPQVNEEPLSQTNGWSMVGAGSAVTEEYNVEGPSVGDVNLNGFTVVDSAGWVFAKSLASETGQIIVANVTSNIALTSTATLFVAYAGSPALPAGTGTDIGIVTSTTVTTVSLYECGMLIAYVLRATMLAVF